MQDRSDAEINSHGKSDILTFALWSPHNQCSLKRKMDQAMECNSENGEAVIGLMMG